MTSRMYVHEFAHIIDLIFQIREKEMATSRKKKRGKKERQDPRDRERGEAGEIEKKGRERKVKELARPTRERRVPFHV